MSLAEVDSAKAAYQQVVDRHPTAKDFVAAARRKLTPLPERDESVADTTNLADNEAQEEQNSAFAILGLEPEDILEEKIAWRRQRDYNE